MVRMTLSGTLEQMHDFMRNRFGLVLAEKGLRCTTAIDPKRWILTGAVIENIDNTIAYVEKENDRAALVIRASETKGIGGRELVEYHFGVALRNKGLNRLELYIDTLDQAVRKGIITKAKKRVKIIYYVVVGVLVLTLFVVTLPLLLFVLCLRFFGLSVSVLASQETLQEASGNHG